MKAITLWQPWASLVACGAKKFETRGWSTSYRGPIAIHAAARNVELGLNAIDDFKALIAVYEALRNNDIVPDTVPLAVVGPYVVENDVLPRSAVIATAEVMECHRISDDVKLGVPRLEGLCGEPSRPIGGDERFFGDWTPGRYAWELVNVKPLPEPVPAKGKQGLWEWEGVVSDER